MSVGYRNSAMHRHVGGPGRAVVRVVAVIGCALHEPSRLVDIGVVDTHDGGRQKRFGPEDVAGVSSMTEYGR